MHRQNTQTAAYREIETLDLENGDIADYRTTTQGMELEVMDAEEKRLAVLYFRWDEVAPLLRGMYARQLDGFGQEQPQPSAESPAFHSETVTVYPGDKKRDVPVLFWVSAEELELIHQKMQQYGTENLSAYLRKMALDGYVVKLELPELKELVSLMRRSSNNLNQLTRKVHETGRVYNADLEDISQQQEQLWEGVKEILTQLSKLS